MMNFLDGLIASVIRGEYQFNLTRLLNDVVLALVLITISMSADDDWLCPSWDESRDV